MKIVIPFCHKDSWLAFRNLEWASKLDGQVDFDAILSYDETTSKHHVENIDGVASGLFRSVTHHRYDPPHVETWPHAANHAWQKAAWRMYDHHQGESWFWWEADATPLRAGWLTTLAKAFKDGGRPFAGHIVMGQGKLGHMNGVGIYPWDVVRRSAHAMTTRNAPFDVVLKEDMIDAAHPLNHLICHFPRANGMYVRVVDKEVADEMLSRGYVLFHGCTDGSLIDTLRGDPAGLVDPENSALRYVELSDIGAPINQTEANWQYEHVRLLGLGWDTISFKECQRNLPQISEQTDWETGTFDLPINRNLCHFNCSITRDGDGTLWLFVRQWRRRSPVDWTSKVLMCRLNKALDVVASQELALTDDPFVQYEDPRAVWHDGKFYVSMAVWSQTGKYAARQIVVELDQNGKVVGDWQTPYGFNDPDAITPEVGGSEKNWVWFRYADQWLCVYQFSPHTVVAADGWNVEVSPSPKNWPYGEIRGGTPPVQVGDEYLTFFHSSLPWKKRQKRYYMGAYCFEAKPPFRVTRITDQPLLSGSEHDTRIVGGPLCVFPGGALFENDQWMVVGGLNDEACFWIKIPRNELLERMTPCI